MPRTRVQQELRLNILGILALALLLWLALVVASVIITRRAVATPLVYLQQAAALIAQGDFDVHIATRSRDVVGQLATALDRMRTSLQQLFAAVQRSSMQVTNSATQLAASGKQLESTVTEQVASTNQVVATGDFCHLPGAGAGRPADQ